MSLCFSLERSSAGDGRAADDLKSIPCRGPVKSSNIKNFTVNYSIFKTFSTIFAIRYVLVSRVGQGQRSEYPLTPSVLFLTISFHHDSYYAISENK